MITRGLTLPPKILSTLNLPQIIDITDQLPKHPSKVWPVRSLESIKLAVQHHTASEAPLINQARYHINAHGWAGLAYSFVVDRGVIYQTNDLLSRTSHAMGVNDFSVGVCINGDLSMRPMTDFERRAIIGIHLMLNELMPDIQVMGHNEASLKYANHRTACPVISMDKLRSDIMTEGLKLAVTETPNDLLAKSVAVRARVEDIYKVAADPNSKYSPEGLRKMNKIYDMMISEGLL